MPRDPNRRPTAYEKRTKYTPDVPRELEGKPLRQIHPYKKLGEGAFGVVCKAVDLATGSVWAVKHCTNRGGGKSEDWKLGFKREVEKLAKIQHVRLSTLI